jgi:hypothetical protein
MMGLCSWWLLDLGFPIDDEGLWVMSFGVRMGWFQVLKNYGDLPTSILYILYACTYVTYVHRYIIIPQGLHFDPYQLKLAGGA